MGAIDFSLSPQLVDVLKRELALEVFVETGTFKGDSLAIAAERFGELHSVELSPQFHAEAAARFRGRDNIHVVLGDSPAFLRELAPKLGKRPALFFLDAHWCVAEGTAGQHSQCPLLAEIAALGKLAPSSVVLIDDARLFLAPPPAPHDVSQWPRFEEIDAALRLASASHELMVVNDVIAFYPRKASAALHSFARRHGVDWLRAAQSLEENHELRGEVAQRDRQLTEKESEIESLRAQVAQLDRQLAEKEREIESLRAEVVQRDRQIAEKEHEIGSLRDAARERETLIKSLDEENRRREDIITSLHTEAGKREEAIKSMHAEAAKRETLIGSLHQEAVTLRDAITSLHESAREREALVKSLHDEARRREDETRANERFLKREIETRDESLAAKEALIRSQDTSLQLAEGLRNLHAIVESAELNRRLMKDLDAKEAVIKEVAGALDAYRRAPHPLKRWFLRHYSRYSAAMRPRLGVLYQYDPRALDVPAHYSQTPKPDPAPRISLVTPSFRQAAFIERTIRSVLDQQYPNLEYWVQDGGSDDGTVEILRRYGSQLAGWESKPDEGQSQAINRGFAHTTTGEIMGWLNSDDLLLPGALAYVADFFKRNPDIDVVYGHRININENDQEIGRWMMPPHDARVLSWADFVPQETLFWRRSIWDKAGGRIDESFRFAMDWDLLVRLRDAGARFARLPRFIGAFRIHPQQKTSAAITHVGFEEMDRIRQRALGRVPTHNEVKRAIAPYLMRHVVTVVNWRLRTRLGMQA